MKYIIMSDGKGTRWNNYLDIPKHLVKVNNIPLIEDTVNKLINFGIKDIVITSHDERYEFNGAKRYAPLNNINEIDKFTYELINNDIVFIYGDTYYSNDDLDKIINTETSSVIYFGDDKSIVAIKIHDGNKFKKCIDELKKIDNIKGNGWNTYEYLNNEELGSKVIKDNFIYIDRCININSKEDLKKLGEI